MSRLTLRHPDGETSIVVARGALEQAKQELLDWIRDRAVFVITSPNIHSLHGSLLDALINAASNWTVLQVPDGESAKDLSQAERLWNEILVAGGKRDSRVVAFGGGSVGDLTGFVAGCFLRGIEAVQIPTTLLAQVDAAIGGKTGVNLPAGKNAVGLFAHPRLVVIDTDLLQTLPSAELRSGLVEVAKMAILRSPELFVRLEENLEHLLEGDPEALEPVVVAAVEGKIAIVEQDPVEKGDRQLLNLGHTVGHALETALAYKDLRHGEAVGYGILFALRLAELRGLERETSNRIRALLTRFQFPVLPQISAQELREIVARDKKAREAGLVWVLPVELGKCEIVADIEPRVVAQELERFLSNPFVG